MTPDKHKAELRKLTGLCGDTDIDMANSEEGKDANYFIAIRVSDGRIRDKVRTVQNKVVSRYDRLKPFLIPLETLHLTLLVIHLEDEEKAMASEILAQCRTEIRKSVLPSGGFTLKFKGLSYFPNPQKKRPPRVLYVKPFRKEGIESLLDKVRRVVKDTFKNRGIPPADRHRDWIPHTAVIKLRENPSKGNEIPKESFENDIDSDFGEEQVSSLYLCPIGEKKAKDGFYKWEAKIDL